MSQSVRTDFRWEQIHEKCFRELKDKRSYLEAETAVQKYGNGTNQETEQKMCMLD